MNFFLFPQTNKQLITKNLVFLIYFKDIHIFVIINNRLTTFHDDSFTPYTRMRHIQRKTPLLSTSCGVLSMFNLKISFVTSERLASFTVIR